MKYIKIRQGTGNAEKVDESWEIFGTLGERKAPLCWNERTTGEGITCQHPMTLWRGIPTPRWWGTVVQGETRTPARHGCLAGELCQLWERSINFDHLNNPAGQIHAQQTILSRNHIGVPVGNRLSNIAIFPKLCQQVVIM